MLYIAGGILLVIIAELTLNRVIGGIAAGAVIIGVALMLIGFADIGVLILKGAVFVIAVLLALRVFKFMQ